jgi:hypothetical protein
LCAACAAFDCKSRAERDVALDHDVSASLAVAFARSVDVDASSFGARDAEGDDDGVDFDGLRADALYARASATSNVDEATAMRCDRFIIIIIDASASAVRDGARRAHAGNIPRRVRACVRGAARVMRWFARRCAGMNARERCKVTLDRD